MRPIPDLSAVQRTSVLYHSAFGFARVADVHGDQVLVEWEHPADNLPYRVSLDNLTRVYSACPPGGFFDRALNDGEQLRELLQIDPTTALHLLLVDLQTPQKKSDLRDWIVGRTLMTERGFDRWWERVSIILPEDGRFRFENDEVALQEDTFSDVGERLKSPLVPAARRLELAIAHRESLSAEAYRHQVLLAWRSGSTPTRDLALQALRDENPSLVFAGLLGPGADSVDAVIHALRNGAWTHEQVDSEVQHALRSRALTTNGTVETEGRLAAALWRWGLPGIDDDLAGLAETPTGQRLVDAAFSALPPRRSEAMATEVLERALARLGAGAETGASSSAAAWCCTHLLQQGGDSASTLANRLEAEHPRVARWLRLQDRPEPIELPLDDETGETLETAEITTEHFKVATAIAHLPPILGKGFLRFGSALARALARHHAANRVVSPTRDSVKLNPDGSVEIAANGDPRSAHRPPGEAPSKASDIYAAGILLVEGLVGRPWPKVLPGDRALPFLRHIAPELPPSAIAPLAAALDPSPTMRPTDASGWALAWQTALASEDARQRAIFEPRTRFRVGYDTHVGRMKILYTQTNQDALYVSTKGSLALMAVCDGISTANTGSGDLAAGITAQVIASAWEQWLPRLTQQRPEDAREFLDRTLRMANQAVCEASLRLAGGRLEGRVPMGTTSVVAVAQGNRVSIAWLGDSRAYLVGPYGASALTADANQAAERMVDWHHGVAPSFDATGFALVRYIGHFDELGRAEPLPALHTSLTVLAGERLVLCSDGITDYIADNPSRAASILGANAASGDPDECARGLVDLANRGGGGDNATCIVAAPASL